MKALQPFLQTGTRRNFLRVGLAGLASAATWASPADCSAASLPAPGRRLILIWLGGGPSTIDMWDLKPDAPAGIRGEFRPIATSVAGISISEQMPQLAKILDRCVLVRSLHHNIAAHGPGTQLMMTGQLPTPAMEYPSVGSLAARLCGGDAAIPPYITLGNVGSAGAGYLGSAWNPFEVDGKEGKLPVGISLPQDVAPDNFAARVALRNRFDQHTDLLTGDLLAESMALFHRQAVDILSSDRIRTAFDVERESETVRERYGRRSTMGQNALKARRLIEAGARFVTIGMDGWDTHTNNFATLRNGLLPQLDQGLSALISDLADRGLLSETVVCCCGEFGRTPVINGNQGRDHWSQAMAVLLAGGGLQSGIVYGATDAHGLETTEAACTPTDLAATLLQQINIEPDRRVKAPNGRPVSVMNGGRVLREIIANT